MGLLVGGDWNMFYDFPETVGKFVVPNCYSAHHFSGRAKNHQPDICIYIYTIKPYQTTMENTPFHHSTENPHDWYSFRDHPTEFLQRPWLDHGGSLDASPVFSGCFYGCSRTQTGRKIRRL